MRSSASFFSFNVWKLILSANIHALFPLSTTKVSSIIFTPVTYLILLSLTFPYNNFAITILPSLAVANDIYYLIFKEQIYANNTYYEDRCQEKKLFFR